MTLLHQVCSLGLARRLRELGAKQESYFYWSELIDEQVVPYDHDLCTSFHDCGENPCGGISAKQLAAECCEDISSAFTVAELGEMLPAKLNIPFKNGRARKVENTLKAYFGNGRDHSSIVYAKPRGTNEYIWLNGDTEADARAKMLIYLLEE